MKSGEFSIRMTVVEQIATYHTNNTLDQNICVHVHIHFYPTDWCATRQSTIAPLPTVPMNVPDTRLYQKLPLKALMLRGWVTSVDVLNLIFHRHQM